MSNKPNHPASSSRPKPSAEELAAEIEAARGDLVTTLDQLKQQSTPAALARRGKSAVLGLFVDEYGGVRPERVAIAVGAVATLVVLRRWRRSRRVRRMYR